MQDPNFMHTVVLICQHDENGAFGMTVNRTADALVQDVFPDTPLLRDLTLPIRSGGPVSPNSLQILHRLPAGIALGDLDPGEEEHGGLTIAGVEVAPGIRLGADLDGLADFLAPRADADEHARFVVGYSGWGEGQLDAEMTTGAWLPVPASPDLVFSKESGEAVWRSALARIPDGGSSLAHLPPDPSWN
jgi:putative transcriptional regulator